MSDLLSFPIKYIFDIKTKGYNYRVKEKLRDYETDPWITGHKSVHKYMLGMS